RLFWQEALVAARRLRTPVRRVQCGDVPRLDDAQAIELAMGMVERLHAMFLRAEKALGEARQNLPSHGSQMARSSSASARVAYRSARWGPHLRPMPRAAPAGWVMRLGLSPGLSSAARSPASMAGPLPANTASTPCRGGCPVRS